MTPVVRWPTAPMPMGCRWCGTEQRGHGQRWVPGHSWHAWTMPTLAQRQARLRFKLTWGRP